MSDAAPSTDSSYEEPTQRRLTIPGAESRKRKHKSSRVDRELLTYMEESTRQLDALKKAEENHLAQEAAAFEKMLKAQHEAEESRFQRMQAQQQANHQMLIQVMGSFISALNPGQPTTIASQPWMPPHIPATTSGVWSVPVPQTPLVTTSLQPVIPMPPHQHLAQPASDDHPQPSVSSSLHDLNKAQHYYNL